MLNRHQDQACLLLFLRTPPSKAGNFAPGFYIGGMKTILTMIVAAVILASQPLHAQDAALAERVDKLAGVLKDVIESQDAQRKQIEALSRNIEMLRERINQSNPDVATQEDLRKLAEKLREVDEKRKGDVALILKEIESLGKSVKANRPAPRIDNSEAPSKPAGNDKGFEYQVQTGDTLSAIVAAYREQGIKVTVDQILAANPGLKATNMKVGQKLFIPAPQ